MKKNSPAWLVAVAALCALTACQSFERGSEAPRKSVIDQAAMKKSAESGPRKRLLVLPFLDANAERSPSIRTRAREAFMVDLNRTGEVLALDSNELKVDPEKFVTAGEYRLNDLAKEAAGLGTAAMLEGKILDIRVKRSADNVGLIRRMTTSFEAVVRVRIASSRGRELFNTVKTVTLEQDGVRVAERTESDQFIKDNPDLIQVIVKDAFLDFTPQILGALGKVTWEGRIAAISGDRIYLNVGRVSGLQVGDLLKVTEDGEDIYDPETGGHIGRVPGRLKGTLEVISYFGTDGAISVIHSGSGFRENDRVELYQ